MTMRASPKLPVTVIGGYLGSGKTTLVNHLLRNAQGRRLAVLVNDFGGLPIDRDLIEVEDEELISIAGGCVCCSYGSDLTDALKRLLRAQARPTHVLIESSGVALPIGVASSVSLLQPYHMIGVTVVCDASAILELSRDKYLADTITAQLEGADLILLNKTDLVEPKTIPAVVEWLYRLAPGIPIVPTLQSQLPIEVVLDINPVKPATLPNTGFHDTSFYQTAHVSVSEPVDAMGLAGALTDARLGVLRAKAILRDPAGSIVQLHVVGRRWDISPLRSQQPHCGNLVTIGIGPNADQQHIERLVRHYVCARPVQ
ncbi:MAG: GTP-binding protein [Gammaproteobacteria bacterium]|nr:GTP-binding protein [Gammaproteobacteria bacterium]